MATPWCSMTRMVRRDTQGDAPDRDNAHSHPTCSSSRCETHETFYNSFFFFFLRDFLFSKTSDRGAALGRESVCCSGQELDECVPRTATHCDTTLSTLCHCVCACDSLTVCLASLADHASISSGPTSTISTSESDSTTPSSSITPALLRAAGCAATAIAVGANTAGASFCPTPKPAEGSVALLGPTVLTAFGGAVVDALGGDRIGTGGNDGAFACTCTCGAGAAGAAGAGAAGASAGAGVGATDFIVCAAAAAAMVGTEGAAADGGRQSASRVVCDAIRC